MPVRVLIPGPLRRLVDDKAEIELEGRTVVEVIRNLEAVAPDLRSRLTGEKGEIRRFIRLFLNDVDVDDIGGAAAPVRDGDVLSIVPAAAGG